MFITRANAWSQRSESRESKVLAAHYSALPARDADRHEVNYRGLPIGARYFFGPPLSLRIVRYRRVVTSPCTL